MFGVGGGATDIRTSTADPTAAADTRLVVAGGSGSGMNPGWGGFDAKAGGAGGGLQGLWPSADTSPASTTTGRYGLAQGGSQTATGASSTWCTLVTVSTIKGTGSGCSTGFGGGGGYWGGGSGNAGGGGGSSYTVPSGTILTNTQGDARCNGNGVMYVTVPPTKPPSPLPTALPTPSPSAPSPSPTRPSANPTPQPSAPTATPTPGPTRRPTQMAPKPGPYYYHTYHAGAQCASTPSQYTVESYQLGACLPPDELSPNYFSMTCKQSIYGIKNTIWKTVYPTGDAACALAPAYPPAIVSHPYTCELQPRGAGYMLSMCGDIPSSIKSRAQILIKAYPQAGGSPKPKDLLKSAVACFSPNVVTRAYILGACQAFKQSGNKVLYYRKFSLVSAAGSTIRLSEARFLLADNRCLQAPFVTIQWSYNNAQAGCARDPLDTSLAYIQAMYYDGNAALRWPTVDAFIRGKMVPTPSPTARPTAPSPAPTMFPTPQPSRPTTAPTVLPTPMPTPIPPSPVPTAAPTVAPGAFYILFATLTAVVSDTSMYSLPRFFPLFSARCLLQTRIPTATRCAPSTTRCQQGPRGRAS